MKSKHGGGSYIEMKGPLLETQSNLHTIKFHSTLRTISMLRQACCLTSWLYNWILQKGREEKATKFRTPVSH